MGAKKQNKPTTKQNLGMGAPSAACTPLVQGYRSAPSASTDTHQKCYLIAFHKYCLCFTIVIIIELIDISG